MVRDVSTQPRIEKVVKNMSTSYKTTIARCDLDVNSSATCASMIRLRVRSEKDDKPESHLDNFCNNADNCPYQSDPIYLDE
jgi:hypothetical protein